MAKNYNRIAENDAAWANKRGRGTQPVPEMADDQFNSIKCRACNADLTRKEDEECEGYCTQCYTVAKSIERQ